MGKQHFENETLATGENDCSSRSKLTIANKLFVICEQGLAPRVMMGMESIINITLSICCSPN